ncbi:hypothetical protein Tco_1006899 [Tanacetum coccineum]|uniref:Uncharacterized protein n=1 Tax=Tanacetum coccineum TaxID=301880 RepID=A0ABQ5FJ20_9ASTR
MALTAYVDADHAVCQDTRRSTSGSAQFLGDKTWKALLVEEYEKETTTSMETDDEIFSVASRRKRKGMSFHNLAIARDLPRDNSLVNVEVLRYDYKRSNVNKGIVRTEMELVLEHTQQGTSNEVSISTKGVEE